MELLFLRTYGNGYRGCVIDDARYRFFQISRRKGLRFLKSYPRASFEDSAHFIAVMQKFVTPPSFLRSPIPIEELTLEHLDRIYPTIRKQRSGHHGDRI